LPGLNSATFNIGTNVGTKVSIQWGLTSDYELGSLMSESFFTEHKIVIGDLTPATVYHFRIVITDELGRSITLENQSLRTLAIDEILVPNVSNFLAVGGPQRITLSWQNPRSHFDLVRIVKSTRFYPNDPLDGEIVYEGRAEEFVDFAALSVTAYYYTAFVKRGAAFSSGSVASATLLKPGERSTVKDLFAGIVELSSDLISPLFQKFSLADVDFIQDGEKLPVINNSVEIRGDRNLKISIDYAKVPEILKTIAITMYDPAERAKTFSFLLRVNPEKTAYEAVIGPLGRDGRFTFGLAILDHKNQGLKKLAGTLVAAVPEFARGAEIKLSDGARKILFSLSATLILILIAALLGAFHRRKGKQTDQNYQTQTQ